MLWNKPVRSCVENAKATEDVATFLPDTSCMVAAVCSWHEHHERAIREIQIRFGRKQHMVVAAPALIEAFSVLTRLPAPHRISPRDALELIEANFLRDVKVVALDAAGYRALLRQSTTADISGGRIYDAVIAACARRAKAETVITFNDSHFAALAASDLEIVVP
jgi:predicted nucleic acid-binding protein